MATTIVTPGRASMLGRLQVVTPYVSLGYSIRHSRPSQTAVTAAATPTRTASGGAQVSREDPRKKWGWNSSDIPSLDGRTFIVTGSSTGMGWYCAKELAQHGGRVIIAARSLERCQRAAEQIKREGISGQVEAMEVDLSSFRSITNFAEQIKKRKIPVDTLVNNAGVFLVPHDFTQEGFETVVGTNYFGTFLLTHLLLPVLKSNKPARVVTMSSLFEQIGTVPWEDLEGYRSKESGALEYSNSKLMVLMMGRELNKRLKGTGMESFISQPGLVKTPLNNEKLDYNKLTSRLVQISTKVYGQKPEVASVCLQRPATDPNVEGYGGSYFSPPWLSLLAIHVDHAGMREPSNGYARDEAAWKQLYVRTMSIVNSKLASRNLPPIKEVA